MSTILYVLLAAAVLIPIFGIYLYNRLVTSRNLVEEGRSGIDVQLERSASRELFPTGETLTPTPGIVAAGATFGLAAAAAGKHPRLPHAARRSPAARERLNTAI